MPLGEEGGGFFPPTEIEHRHSPKLCFIFSNFTEWAENLCSISSNFIENEHCHLDKIIIYFILVIPSLKEQFDK